MKRKPILKMFSFIEKFNRQTLDFVLKIDIKISRRRRGDYKPIFTESEAK